jgi:hypothetical protein
MTNLFNYSLLRYPSEYLKMKDANKFNDLEI